MMKMLDDIIQRDAPTKRADYTRVALLILISLFGVTAMSRVAGVFIGNWTIYGGEMFINFPALMVLDWINPTLWASVISEGSSSEWPQGPAWFYGPFHHIAYVPLLAWMPSAAVFFQILLVVFIVGICAALAAVALGEQTLSPMHRRLFLLLMVALTFNQFAVIDNLRQRNSELLEFILLLSALWALNRRREKAGGSLLALAALTKLLPAVFFIALPLKRMSRAVIAYLATTLVVVALAQGMLGWENWGLLGPNVPAMVGVPTVDAMQGETAMTPPSVFRSSFYTLLLLPYYDISFSADDPQPSIQRVGASLRVPNIAFFVIVLILGAVTAVAVARSGDDWLFAFGLLGTLMLIASPHCNPHYYVFSLFGFFWFARRSLERREVGRLAGCDVWMVMGLVVLLLMFGSLIPFSVIDRVFGLALGTYFHMMAVYGIQALANVLLWCLLVFTKFRLDAGEVVPWSHQGAEHPRFA